MDIVSDIRTNREEGAKRLESEYKAQLYAVALRLGADPAEAEALVYRTIDEAVRSIDGYTEQSAFFAWLCKILVNCHGKATRRKSHERILYMESLPEASDPSEEDGHDRVIQAVDAEILRDAIEALPEEMREAVILRYFMDVPLAKMAQILTLPIGTVKSRLHYARIILARRLGATMRKPAVALIASALVLSAFLVSVSGVILFSAEGAAEAVELAAPAAAKPPSNAFGLRKFLNTMSFRLARAFSPHVAAASADDPYLESDGSQVIVLDYRVNGRTKLKLDFQLMSTNAVGRKILGAFSGDANAHRASLWYNGGGNIEFNVSDTWHSTVIAGDLARHTAIIDLPNRMLAYDVWSQGFRADVKDWEDGESYPLGLFAENIAAVPTNVQMKAAVRIYGLEIYEGGALVRRYTPVVKGGKEGLLDAVTGRFACSQKPLVCGGDILRMADDVHLISDRSQLLALDYAINANTRLEVDYALVAWTRGDSTLFGSANPETNGSFRCMYWVSGGGNMQFNVNGAWIESFTGAGTGRHRAVVDFPKMRVEYMTGETAAFVRPIPAASAFTAARKPLPIMVFGENWGDPSCAQNRNGRTVSMKLYGIRAYENGVLVRDYRPFLHNGVPCLRDRATGIVCGDPRSHAPLLACGGLMPYSDIFESMVARLPVTQKENSDEAHNL